MRYEILKAYNNNVVLAKDKQRQVILVSKGIGFGKKTGDIVENPESIEKVFHELSAVSSQLQVMDDLTQLIDYVTVEFLQIASAKLGYIVEQKEETIKEHISFAISRLKMGLSIDNPFLDEIVTLYRAEYKVASIARQLIAKKMNIDIGEEEQGFIALHLYAAKNEKTIQETIETTRLYKGCMHILEKVYGRTIPLRTVVSKQFLNSMRVMIQLNRQGRIVKMPFAEQVQTLLPKAHEASVRIGVYLKEEKNIELTNDEKAYLALDIEKFIQSTDFEHNDLPKMLEADETAQESINKYIESLGGYTNIVTVDACTTRLRVKVVDKQLINRTYFEESGIRVIETVAKTDTVQLVLGIQAEILAKQMRRLIQLKEEK